MPERVPERIMPALMTSKEAAAFLAVSEATLSRWRTYGGGPRVVNLSGIYRYARADQDTYVRESTR